MAKYEENKAGYIVFEDGGTSLLTYGGAEDWFPTYDDAVSYAMGVVTKRVSQLKDYLDYNSVIVYEGGKELIHTTHGIPCGRVVFQWSNYEK